MKILRFLLFPFAILYAVITTIRNLFFDKKIFKETKFKTPVIVVGNLSVGGTGKTPQIEYLIRLLQETYKIAVLSRGYQRKTKGFILLNKSHVAKDVGDEPLQYFKKFKNITVAVDANRVEGIKNLVQNNSPEVILLDDAFQHRKVKGSFYILLTKYDDLFVNDFLLPTGNLRERRSGANRANVILVTKCPEHLSKVAQDNIRKKLQKFNKAVFFTSISYNENLSGFNNIAVKNLIEYEVLLLTGIANPKPLLNFLDNKKVNYQHLKYADHHHFSKEELNGIQQKFDAISSKKKIILTTEKDYVRLESDLKEISFLGIRTTFLNGTNIGFNSIIENHLKNIL